MSIIGLNFALIKLIVNGMTPIDLGIMKKTLFTLALLVSSLTATSALANKNYVAKPEQSKWVMLENSPLECRLSHNIPNYGNAEFSSYANKKMNLDFELKMNRPMGETRSVNLVSMPPRWTPGESADSMTNLKFFKQFDGYVGGTTAWSMLAELENGRFPTFTYADWQSPKQLIEVALSPVVFQNTYNVFSMCIANLLPYSFEDISFTILHFDKNSDELNKASKKRLQEIGEEAVIMHPGPHIIDEDITADVLRDPRCLIRTQVTNGVFMRAALLSYLLKLEVKS